MSFENEIIARLVTPKSESDSAYEEFEYLLRWINPNGSIYMYMFTDWENQDKYEGLIMSSDDNEYIRNIPSPTERRINLIAENLNKNDFEQIKKINNSVRCERLYKDGTYEGVAIVPGSYSYKQQGLRYTIEISIRLEDLKTVS